MCESCNPRDSLIGNLTAYTAGFRAGVKWAKREAQEAAWDTYHDNIQAAATDDLRDLDHRTPNRWHE